MTVAAESLVESAAEQRALAALRDAAGESDGVMERHCVRCFLLSEKLAARNDAELDREVALCAAFLHDIGLYDAVTEGGVYTEEGAELARKLGLESGWDERPQLCADACAYHHSLKPQWELGAEVETLRLADRIEVFGGPLIRSGLTRAQVREVNAAAPRDGFYRGLVHVVWPVLRSRPRTLARVFKP